jgi:PAS domain-containing protein
MLEAFGRMSGYTQEELLALGVNDLVDRGATLHTDWRLARIVAQGEDRFELRCRALWGGPPGPRGSPWTRTRASVEQADEGVGRGPRGTAPHGCLRLHRAAISAWT